MGLPPVSLAMNALKISPGPSPMAITQTLKAMSKILLHILYALEPPTLRAMTSTPWRMGREGF